MLPPEMPSTMRATNTQPSVGAKASPAQPKVAPICEMMSTRLRPMRSLALPQSGPARNWQSAKTAKSTPTATVDAPKCFT